MAKHPYFSPLKQLSMLIQVAVICNATTHVYTTQGTLAGKGTLQEKSTSGPHGQVGETEGTHKQKE